MEAIWFRTFWELFANMEALLQLICLEVLFNSLGYLLYFFQMKRGESEPKSISWGTWSALSLVNFIFCKEMTNFFLSLLSFSDVVFCTIIFFYVYRRKEFSEKDYKVLGLAVIAMLFWILFRDAKFSSVLLCICYAISFFPTIKEVWEKPNSENPLSWYICSTAYAVHIYNLYLHKAEIIDYFVPVTLFVLHLIVAILARKKQLFESPVN